MGMESTLQTVYRVSVLAPTLVLTSYFGLIMQLVLFLKRARSFVCIRLQLSTLHYHLPMVCELELAYTNNTPHVLLYVNSHACVASVYSNIMVQEPVETM